jgi:hypothetical protein
MKLLKSSAEVCGNQTGKDSLLEEPKNQDMVIEVNGKSKYANSILG